MLAQASPLEQRVTAALEFIVATLTIPQEKIKVQSKS
jgi:hypothetical protein